MKTVLKNSYLIITCFMLLTSCNSDDDTDLSVDPINEVYTEEEKQAEIEWIKSYSVANGLDTEATASGLHYVIHQQGEGEKPKTDSNVQLAYTFINAENGEIINEATVEEPFESQVDFLIEGVQEGLLLLNEGGSASLLIPSYLAYGKRGFSFGMFNIDPETIIIFEVELLKIL